MRRSAATTALGALMVAGVLVAVLVAGIWLGGHAEHLPGFLRGSLTGGTQRQTLDRVIDLVHDDYYREIPDDRLVDSSVDGIVASLKDQFSTYYDPHAYTALEQASAGHFTGIGVTIVDDPKGGLRIVHVFAGSPAARAKLVPGDRIVGVGGEPLHEHSSAHAVALIKGEPGTSVTLAVRSAAGARRSVRIERSEIEVPQATSRLVRHAGVPYADIHLASFNNGAHAEVRQAVDALRARGAKGIVLDLRGNGGGLVEEAVLIASTFVPKGTIVTMRSRSQGTKTLAAAGGAISTRVPVVVLVDRNTASASEIVAGALQDHDRATIVGTRTFGKGVFQELDELPNGGALQITVGEYFTPDGHNLGGGGVRRGAGIHPDVEARDRPGTKVDEGLQTALRVLAGKRNAT